MSDIATVLARNLVVGDRIQVLLLNDRNAWVALTAVKRVGWLSILLSTTHDGEERDFLVKHWQRLGCLR